MKDVAIDQVFLSVEELDQRIAPGLTDLCGVALTVPTIGTDCPPPPSDTTTCPTPTDTSGGNNGYGNGGFDGVPGDSTSNPSPTSDEKAADIVR